MSWRTKVYGWQDGENWHLSYSPRDTNKARNTYATKDEAEKAARHKMGQKIIKMMIVWE